jgi:hypothetical protein
MAENNHQSSDWIDVAETSLSDVTLAAAEYSQDRSPEKLKELTQALNTAEILGVDTVLIAVQLIKSLPPEVKKRFAQRYHINDVDLKNLLEP